MAKNTKYRATHDEPPRSATALAGICITAAVIGLIVGVSVEGGYAALLTIIGIMALLACFKGMMSGVTGDAEVMGVIASAIGSFLVTLVFGALCMTLDETDSPRHESKPASAPVYVRPYR